VDDDAHGGYTDRDTLITPPLLAAGGGRWCTQWIHWSWYTDHDTIMMPPLPAAGGGFRHGGRRVQARAAAHQAFAPAQRVELQAQRSLQVGRGR